MIGYGGPFFTLLAQLVNCLSRFYRPNPGAVFDGLTYFQKALTGRSDGKMSNHFPTTCIIHADLDE